MWTLLFYLTASLAGIFGIIGILWYAEATKDPENKPNLIIIILWLIISVLLTSNYKIILNDWVKIAPSIIAVLGNLYVLVVLIKSRNYLFLKWDILIVFSGIIISIALFVLMKVKDLHILLQVINTSSYGILIWRIIQGKGKEPLGPWAVMTLATQFSILTVLHNQKDVWDIIQPVRSLICQSIVILFIVYKKKKAT